MKKITKNPVFYLILAIILYIATFFYLSFYKYANFLYNLEDLSIFTNTLYNTAHGNWFWFSTHGGYSYLGDHLELSLLFLVPFYRLSPSSLTLLFFQTLLMGLSAWPLYLIAKKLFSNSQNLSLNIKKFAPLVVALIYLSNPYLHNINLEEFHLAPFLIFFFLWTFYFYLQKNYRLFGLFFILTLISREDACLTLGALALLSFWEYRKNLWMNKKWWFYPLLASGAWFLLAMFLIKLFNPGDTYKYLLLYGNLFNPLTWVPKFFNTKIIFLLLGLFLPFLFIPILKPKYLFLALPTFLQIALLDSQGIAVVFSTHYQTFFLIPLFLAFTETAAAYNFKQKNLVLILALVLGAQFFISAYLGPLNFLTNRQNYLKNLEDKTANQKMISLLPADASLSGPYRLLPNLSNRQTAYVNKLAFLGKKHLSTQNFSLPNNTEYLLLDSTDMIEYYLHFTNRNQLSPMYWQGPERLHQTIARLKLLPIAQSDSLILFGKSGATTTEPFNFLDSLARLPQNFISQPQNFGPVKFLGYTFDQPNTTISLFFQTTKKITDDYFLNFSTDSWNKIYPPAYGLLPTHDWPTGKIIILHQSLPILPDAQKLKMELVQIRGDIELGPLNDTRLVIDKKNILGETILDTIPYLR